MLVNVANNFYKRGPWELIETYRYHINNQKQRQTANDNAWVNLPENLGNAELSLMEWIVCLMVENVLFP